MNRLTRKYQNVQILHGQMLKKYFNADTILSVSMSVTFECRMYMTLSQFYTFISSRCLLRYNYLIMQHNETGGIFSVLIIFDF